MKKMCKLVKEGKLKKNKDYLKAIKSPTHFCKKCGCVSNDKKSLCEEVEIP